MRILRPVVSRCLFAVCLVLAASSFALAASTMEEEFKVKRQEPFEFAEKPTVTKQGDRVTIRFKAKAFCDVTVAIEDTEGRILRHLASGVLGKNAPPPFKKDSLEQTLLWDSKDDKGEYYDDVANTVIRVSLGLKARFERQFLWSPHRSQTATVGLAQSFSAQPEGVYVYDGNMVDHLRLFSHQGDYLRTVYPFESGKLDRLAGVRTRAFEQSGKTLPRKSGFFLSTLLTSGQNTRGRTGEEQLSAAAASAMTVRNGRIALAFHVLNRLATDSTTGGLRLEGPATHVGGHFPRSLAISPDGKTLYLTGFNLDADRHPHLARIMWLHGVGRIDLEKGEKMETFAGALSSDPKQAGTEPGKFRSPVSVDTDPQGRVYVADYANDRVQIFSPDGKHLKNLPIPGGQASRPAEVVINQRNGDIYVFSWYLQSFHFSLGAWPRTERLFHFGPFDKPELKGQYALPIPDQSRRGRYGGDKLQGREFRATIDPWAEDNGPPHVWILRGFRQSPAVYRINPEKKALELVKDFASEAARAQVGNRIFHAALLCVNPKTGELYIANWGHGTQDALVLQPETGRLRAVKLPQNTVEMDFDIDGHAYLSTARNVSRFAVSANDQWREVPFDYGEAIAGRISALQTGGGPYHSGGVSVSIRGHVIVAVQIGGLKMASPEAVRTSIRTLGESKGWTPQIFRGRGGILLVRVWDRYGKMIYEDAVRGIGFAHNVYMDKDNNIYLVTGAKREGYTDVNTGTLVKLRPNGRILSSDSVLPLQDLTPKRPPDTRLGAIGGQAWWEGAEWFYGGVGYNGKNSGGIHPCHCKQFRFTHDYFARSFVPETVHYTVGVLDSAGNLILRIGQYGNVDDGVPMVADPRIPKPRSVGGDEVALFHPAYVAVHSDRRLFINDPGNDRMLSVKLDYHASEEIRLKDVAGN